MLLHYIAERRVDLWEDRWVRDGAAPGQSVKMVPVLTHPVWGASESQGFYKAPESIIPWAQFQEIIELYGVWIPAVGAERICEEDGGLSRARMRLFSTPITVSGVPDRPEDTSDLVIFLVNPACYDSEIGLGLDLSPLAANHDQSQTAAEVPEQPEAAKLQSVDGYVMIGDGNDRDSGSVQPCFVYKVGSLYNPGRTSWPETFELRHCGRELVIFVKSPTPAEVAAVQSGACEFAVAFEEGIVFFLSRFGASGRPDTGFTWSDSPYSWWLAPEDERSLPDPGLTGEKRSRLEIKLVDAASGILRALRVVSLSPAVSAALHAAIREQASVPWPGDRAYDAALARAYSRFPMSSAMLTVARACGMGGA